MTKKRKSHFRGTVAFNAKQREKKASAYGYLNLPKDVKIFSIEEDTKVGVYDFLPYEVTDTKHPDRDDERNVAVDGNLWYRRPFKIHRIPKESGSEAIICPTSIGKPCPICEYFRKQQAEKVNWDDIKDLKPKPRTLFIVIPLGGKETDEVPHIFDMSDFCLQDIIDEELGIDPDNEIFPDLEEGKTLRIKWKWEKTGTGIVFPKARDIRFNDREAYEEDILDEVPNLDEVLNVLDYKKIEDKFFGDDDEPEKEVTEIEEEEEPAPKRTSRKSRTRKEETKEDEPSPTEETKEDEPKRRRRRGGDKAEKNKCPHGFKFGEDWDTDKKCEECDLWNECDEENQRLNK